MLDIVEAKYLDGYKIHLRFENDAEGVVDFADRKMINLTEAWKDLDFFKSFKINHQCGTIEWPNGMDISPEFLFSKVTGIPQQAAFAVMLGEKAKLKAGYKEVRS